MAVLSNPVPSWSVSAERGSSAPQTAKARPAPARTSWGAPRPSVPVLLLLTVSGFAVASKRQDVL